MKTSNTIFELTRVMKKGSEVFEAIFTSCQDRGDYYYVRYTLTSGIGQGVWGYCRIYKDMSSKPYGIKKVVRTGKKWSVRPFVGWSPRPGDPGYDLMC